MEIRGKNVRVMAMLSCVLRELRGKEKRSIYHEGHEDHEGSAPNHNHRPSCTVVPLW